MTAVAGPPQDKTVTTQDKIASSRASETLSVKLKINLKIAFEYF